MTPDTPQKIVDDIMATQPGWMDEFDHSKGCWHNPVVEQAPARIQAMIDQRAGLLEEAAAALKLAREFIQNAWEVTSGDNDHELGVIEAVLAKVAETRPAPDA